MARPRTASKILDARGAFKKDPQRARHNEPEPAKGNFRKQPPKSLTTRQKSCWRDIVKLAPQGVLTKSDEITVEVAACLLSEFRMEPTLMATAKLTRLQVILGRLGMDPSGRAGLSVDKKKKGSFDDV